MGTLSRLCATLVSAAVPCLAFSTPTVTPVFDLDPPQITPSNTSLQSAAIASDGTNSLVVWPDTRLGSPSELFAARVTSAGKVLDPAGFPIHSDGLAKSHPAIAYGAGEYLVVWDQGTTLAGAVVNPDGTIKGTLWSFAPAGSRPSVASDGNGFFIVWERAGGTSDSNIVGAYVDGMGQSMGNPFDLTPPATNKDTVPKVSFDGSKYLVVWQRSAATINPPDADVVGALIPPATPGIGTPFVIAGTPAFEASPSVAFSAGSFLVSWNEGQAPALTPKAVRVDTAGAAIGSPLALGPAGDYGTPSIASTSTDFLVSWSFRTAPGQLRRIEGARVSGAGALLDATPAVFTTNSLDDVTGGASFDGTSYVLSWIGGTETLAARVKPADASVLDTPAVDVSTRENSESGPSVAASAQGYFVAWNDIPPRNVRGVHLDLAGKVLDSSAIDLLWTSTSMGNPAVASDGSNWLVSTFDGGLDYVRFFLVTSTTSAQTGAIQLNPVGTPGFGPKSLAFGGGEYFAVWRTMGTLPNCCGVFGVRIDASGHPIDTTPIQIASLPKVSPLLWTPPSVAWDGVAFWVIWDESANQSNNRALKATRYDVGGNPIGAGPWEISPTVDIPSTVACGSTCLLAYAPWGYGVPGIVDTQFGQDGKPIHTNDLFPATSQDLVWDGTQWLLTGISSEAGNDVSILRLSPVGGVFAPGAFPVLPSGSPRARSVVTASAAAGTALVVLDSLDGSTTERARAVFVSNLGVGSPSPAGSTSSSATTGGGGASSSGSATAGTGGGGGSSARVNGSSSGCSCRAAGADAGGSGVEWILVLGLAAHVLRHARPSLAAARTSKALRTRGRSHHPCGRRHRPR